MANVFTPKSEKEANQVIKLIKDAGVKLDARIHDTAVQGIAHCLAYGDTTIVSNLAKAMPKSARGNALKYFITQHLPVEWNKKAHGDGGFKLKKDHGLQELHWCKKLEIVLNANASPFYNKEDKEASVFNPNTSVLTLLKRTDKEHIAFTSDSVRALEKLLERAKFEAEKVEAA